MPKRGGRGGRWSDGERPQNNYNEHDDRRENNVRRVSFKTNSFKNKHKPWNAAIKKLEDDDIDMNDQAIVNTGRNHQNFERRGAFRGRREIRIQQTRRELSTHMNQQRRQLAPGCFWYQVSIPYGQKHEKSFLLKALMTNMSPDEFTPHYYTVQGHAVVFYIDDFKMAEKLQNCDRQISMPNGYTLSIRVKPGTPQVTMDQAFLQKMQLAMSGRYNAATKALDLTKFHADPALLDVFCPLFRPSVMMKALDIIVQHIPDLEALNLNDNNLQNMVALKNFTKLPNLNILYLANNKIRDMGALEPLKILNLKELFLQGNPVSDRYKERDAYIRDVQRKFPKLTKLDGALLPPVIGFDVNDDTNIPPSQPSFLCNTEAQGIIQEFLKQYYMLYDSSSRQPLLDAYHENAIFSLSASYAPSQNQHHPSNKLNSYLPHSRNLMRSQDRKSDGSDRSKNIKVGRLQIVSFINDLPKTQHDLMSFTVDVTLYTPTFLMFTVNGVFKEVIEPAPGARSIPAPCRAFQRSMIVVPYGPGFCVQNDILYITNATLEQEQKFLKPSIVRNPTPAPVAVTAPAPVPQQPAEVPPELQQQLVQAISMQTNMNLQWSMNCLRESNWDMNRAMFVFTDLHKKGSIPPEAFVK